MSTEPAAPTGESFAGTGSEPADPPDFTDVPPDGAVPEGVPPEGLPPEGLPPEGLPPDEAESGLLESSGPWLDPLALVVGVVAVGVVVAALHHPRVGMFVVSAGLAAGALLRLVLTRRRAGLLAVRSRRVDVAILMGLSAALGVLAAVTPFPPDQG